MAHEVYAYVSYREVHQIYAQNIHWVWLLILYDLFFICKTNMVTQVPLL